MKQTKRSNLIAGESALENLVAWDYTVHQFNESHFRINNRLDVWPTTKKYYDTKTQRRGTYDELESFVKNFLKFA